ncbi:hypothetical protein [Mycobacterium asiaticum]|uniref:Integral membrane protein n=1 Tax=Mycobacterium asiaticum TaxID=1790 RepID=A0A1A3CMB2_MYCAS|nr:hypothetical protein [Mycobacterium asiaticum]OBI87021.1 hypothetical protein A5661_09505 [Mycobacterium asiaticum]OBJ90156.1 hypothetical protein A5640_26050 [Mycobacterium asiaticum]
MLGLLTVGTAAVGSHGAVLAVAGAAVLAVGAGTIFRPGATVAVLLSVVLILLSEPSQGIAALSGLFATAYLVCRHAVSVVDAGSWPTIIGAVGFTAAGLVATSFPLQVPWLPLIAPLGVLGIYALTARPFLN